MKKKMAWLVLCAFALSIFPNVASAATSYQYEYDKNNRLIHISISGAPTYYGFKYDKNGNLLKAEQLGKVSNLRVTTGNGSASLTWTAPTIGKPISYQVYTSGGVLLTNSTTWTNYTVSNLSTGTYTFSIVPIYDTGAGPSVSTAPVQVTKTSGGGGVTPGDPTPNS